MNLVQGVDLSFSKLTQQVADQMWADGIRVIAQCLWTGAQSPPHARHNTQVSLDGGFVTVGYCSVNGVRRGLEHVDEARAILAPSEWDKLALVPIDVELYRPEDGGIPSDSIIWDALFAAEKPMCIYTAKWYWANYKANTDLFSRAAVLLWTAWWDQEPDADYLTNPASRYGGWGPELLAGEQWSGSYNYGSVIVDRDTFDLDIIKKEEPMPTNDELAAEIEALKIGRGWMLGALYVMKTELLEHVGDKGPHIDSDYLKRLDARYEIRPGR